MKKNDNSFINLKRLINVFPKKWLLVVGVLISCVLAVTQIFFSYLIKTLLNGALAKDLDLLYTTLYITGGALIVEILLEYFKVKTLGKYTEQGVAKLRSLFATKISQLSYSRLEKDHSGDLVSRANNDISKVRNFGNVTIANLIFRPLAAIGAFSYLLILNWKLTVLVSVVIPLMIYGSNFLSKPMSRYGKKLQEKLGQVNSISQDTISGIEISKAFTLEDELNQKYDESVDESVKWGKKLAKRQAGLTSFSQVISMIPFLITFGFGGYWTIQGQMTAGGLLAFINLLNHITFPLTQLPQLIGNVKRDMAAAGRIFEILDCKGEREDGHDLGQQAKTIVEFSDVSFGYPGDSDQVINNLSFNINRGETVALVGPSGGGKSTIMKLVLGYYPDYTGQIDIFEGSLNSWNLISLRDKISLVAQDTYLFPDSIGENISYGKPGASRDEIEEATRNANAHQFITGFEKSYETDVGELGNKLSGGQKQRISIARAILKDAPLLLLDEATSALDNRSENLVQEALDKFMGDRTSLVIAHRLSTIINADRILVIDNGTVVETGNHQELLDAGGLYSKLYYTQLANNGQKDSSQEVS